MTKDLKLLEIIEFIFDMNTKKVLASNTFVLLRLAIIPLAVKKQISWRNLNRTFSFHPSGNSSQFSTTSLDNSTMKKAKTQKKAHNGGTAGINTLMPPPPPVSFRRSAGPTTGLQRWVAVPLRSSKR